MSAFHLTKVYALFFLLVVGTSTTKKYSQNLNTTIKKKKMNYASFLFFFIKKPLSINLKTASENCLFGQNKTNFAK